MSLIPHQSLGAGRNSSTQAEWPRLQGVRGHSSLPIGAGETEIGHLTLEASAMPVPPRGAAHSDSMGPRCHPAARTVTTELGPEFDRTLRNRAHVSRSRACRPAPERMSRVPSVGRPGECPSGAPENVLTTPRRAAATVAATAGPWRPNRRPSVTGISPCRPLDHTTRRWVYANRCGRCSPLTSRLTRTSRPPMRIPELLPRRSASPRGSDPSGARRVCVLQSHSRRGCGRHVRT